MRSEQQHIDDFFRKKDEENMPGTGHADIHWQQMQALLKPGAHPAPKNYRLQTTRRIIKYLGGFTVVTVITLIWLNTSRTVKKQPVAKTVAQKGIITPAKKQWTANKPTAPQKSVEPSRTVTKKTTVQPAKPQPAYPGIHTKQESAQLMVSEKNTTPEPVGTNLLQSAEKTPEQAPDSAVAAQQLAAFYEALQKPAQQFVINTNRDTTIIGQQGTRLTIPALAFATRKKGAIKGNLQIVLREYYTYEDILAAKLTTTFGNEQLESGGMVHISANIDGEEAGLKTGKQIKLEMPTTSFDEEMQLFSGVRSSIKPAFQAKFMNNTMIDTVHFMRKQADENGNIDWVPEGQQQRNFSMHDNSQKIKVLKLYNDPFKLVHGKITKAWFYIAPESPFSKEEMKTKLLEHANGYYDHVIIKKPARNNKFLFWRKKPQGPMVADSVEMSFAEALKMKWFTPEDSLRTVLQLRKDSADEAALRQQMNRYSFSIGNLGWFNCDRFSKERGPKVLFAFNPGEAYDARTMVSHLVFDRYRSVLRGSYAGGKIEFGRVPKNEPVKLVSIGIKNGHVMACIKSLNATGNEIGNLAFEETTPEQFRQKLQTLGISLP
jgi:hypothetical protein